MRRLNPTIALYFALLLTIAELVFLVGTRSLTFGSNQGGWTYGYFAGFRFVPLLGAIGLSLVLVALLRFSLHLINHYQSPLLFLWMAVGTAGQLLLHSLYPYSVQDVVGSDAANTYYSLSLRFGAYDLLSRYNTIAPSLPLHAKANMPGK